MLKSDDRTESNLGGREGGREERGGGVGRKERGERRGEEGRGAEGSEGGGEGKSD